MPRVDKSYFHHKCRIMNLLHVYQCQPIMNRHIKCEHMRHEDDILPKWERRFSEVF